MQCIQTPGSWLVDDSAKRQCVTLNPKNNYNEPDIIMDLSIEKTVRYPEKCAVYVHNLCKRYDSGPPIIENLCMNVGKGTIYGLLGSSGCGKTTILSCIVGLTKWSSGEVLVFGKKPGAKDSGIPGKRLGYMPQEIALYSTLTIREMIHFYGRIYNMDTLEVMERMEELNNLLDLPDNTKVIGKLSGGQKRRASLALALIHSPELLVLDEPTVGLDPLLRIKIWDHLYEMVRVCGSTIIITTHYIEEARCANMIGLVRSGHMLLEDTPARLLQNYQCDLLEEVILQLCRKDETAHTTPNPQYPTIGDECDKNKDLFGVRWNEDKISSIVAMPDKHELMHGKYRKEVVFDRERYSLPLQRRESKHFRDDDSVSGKARHSLRRTYGMSSIILTIITRYPPLLVLVLLLPTSKAIISILIMGTVPTGMHVGIVNHEVEGNWTEECGLPSHLNNSCDLELLSCKFLQQLETSHAVVMKTYQSEEDALAQVQYGSIMGYVTIPENYSKNALDFDVTKQFAINETIEGSRIRARLDHSQYLAAIFAIKHLMTSYFGYIHKLATSCDLIELEAAIPPLNFREPVYGNTENNYTDYILPGVVLVGVINVSSALTALMLIHDRREGNVSRALVAGLTVSDLMTSHVITQGIIVIVQIVILGVVLYCVFGLAVMGSLWLCLLICLLTGLCGALLGILLGIICNDEMEAVIVEIFAYPSILFLGGILWPAENMMTVGRYIGYALPTSLITTSLRSVVIRGVGLVHPSVWPGVVVLLAWILVSTICCVVAYRIFCK